MYQDYPKRIRELREQKHISQEELAADCSMCVRTYRAIEHGTSDAKVSQLYAIAKCLGTTLPDLLR